MKRFLLFLLLLSVSFASYAERVRSSAAKNVAKTILPDAELADVSVQTNFSNFYIFSSENGFVIVSADDRALPVIAYSDKNPFVVKDMSVNVYEWLKNVDKTIQGLIDDNVVASEAVKAEWKSFADGKKPSAKYRSAVEPLVKTTWDQGYPFNYMCPVFGEERAVTGCVATAMAQIMKYWEWPHRGVGEKSYMNGYTGGSVIIGDSYTTVSANFGETVYDWDNMLDSYYRWVYDENGEIVDYVFLYNTNDTLLRDAVSELMYHCGVSVSMTYGPNESGAYSSDVDDALKNYFNYDPNLQIVDKYNYTDEEWKDLLKGELNAGRPVYYSGDADDGEAGHAFVCDGYDANDYFHFNWGWGGYCDGYYAMGALVPGTGGIGSGESGDYSKNNEIIIGVQPNPATPRPNAPENLTAEVNFPNATITWSEVADAAYYKLYRDGFLVAADITDNSYTDNAPGRHAYYVRSVAENGVNSVNSETLYVESLYPGPELTNLTAERYDVNNVNLTWTIPEPESHVLKYGEEKPYDMGYGISLSVPMSSFFGDGNKVTRWGHKFSKEELLQHAGMAITSVETMLEEDPEVGSRQYELQIYTQENLYKIEKVYKTELVYSQEFTYTSDFNEKWFTVILDVPYLLDYGKDVLIILRVVDDGDVNVPVSSGGENPYSHVYSYSWDMEGTFEDEDSYGPMMIGGGLSWMIKTNITDGAYTYNVYRDGEKIASEVKEKSYDDIGLEVGTYEYSVETNYFGGVTEQESVVVDMSEPEEYTVAVSANPEDAGSVEGGGTYFETTYVTVKATPNLGYAFKKWTENGTQVSTDLSYKFRLTGNRNLVAEFVDNDLSVEVVSVTSPSCAEESDGWIEVKAKLGQSPYIYKLGDDTSVALDTSYVFENLAVGTYTIEVTDATGFSVTTAAEVKASDEDLDAGAITAGSEEIVANKNAAVIASVQDATGPGKLTYRWKMNGEVLENSNSSQYTPYAENLAVGKYVFTREVKNNCTDWMTSEGEWVLFVRTNTIPAPSNVKAVANGTKIRLSWDPVEGAVAYGIMNGGNLIDATYETYADISGASPNSTYCFTVVSITGVDDEGYITDYSEESEEACVTTGSDDGGDDTEVLPPSNVKAVATGSTSIKLSWKAVEGALAYGIVYKGEYIGATYETFTELDDLSPETTYCFAVFTITEVDAEGYITGYSEDSDEACATTKPDAVEEVTASFNLYPNPVNDKLYIETDIEIEDVVVYDVYGRQQAVDSDKQYPLAIDVSDLTSGAYLIKIVTDDGGSIKRFVKK